MKNIKKKDIKFSNVNKYEKPFKYFHVKEVLSDEFADKLIKWFESTPNFTQHNRTNHYKNSTFHISSESIPEELKEFLTVENFKNIKNKVEEIFEVPFSDKFILSVHRYLPSEGTLIHNDYLEKEDRDEHFFTHRFFIYINRDWKEDAGGILGIFSDNNSDSLRDVVKPVHNTGVGLEFSKKSWHAVSAIREGVRYALHFNFTTRDKLYINET